MFKTIIKIFTTNFTQLFKKSNTIITPDVELSTIIDTPTDKETSTHSDDPYWDKFVNGELTQDEYSEKRRFGKDWHKIVWDNSHNIDHSMKNKRGSHSSSYRPDNDDSSLFFGAVGLAMCSDSNDSFSSGE